MNIGKQKTINENQLEKLGKYRFQNYPKANEYRRKISRKTLVLSSITLEKNLFNEDQYNFKNSNH
jgi:hypothetical protein